MVSKDIAVEESGLKTESNAESGMKSGMKTENNAESGMKSGMKTDNNTESGLKATQKQILLLIKQNPQISITAIAETLKMAKSGIAKQMRQLQASGIIKRVGPDKGGHWETVEDVHSSRRKP